MAHNDEGRMLRKTRRLNAVIRKGARRAAARAAAAGKLVAADAPLSGVRFLDARDARWRSVHPGPEGTGCALEAVGDEEGLAFVLRLLEEEFVTEGRSYPAAAARDARRKLAEAPAGSDVPDGFHPALWPHIRRIENRIARATVLADEQADENSAERDTAGAS